MEENELLAEIEEIEEEIIKSLYIFIPIKYKDLIQMGVDRKKLDSLFKEMDAKIMEVSNEFGKEAEKFSEEETLSAGKKILKELEILKQKLDLLLVG